MPTATLSGYQFRILFLVLIPFSTLAVSHSTAEEFTQSPVSFDVPKSVCVSEIADPELAHATPRKQVYEICLPVSTLVRTRKPLPPYQLWFFVQAPFAEWNVVDLQPQTELTTHYIGPLEIDRQEETSSRAGVSLSGKLDQWGNVQANSELSGRNKELRRAIEAPPMMLLRASGTVDRGTGVYYKFRPSKQTTLEGSRELSYIVEVPATWRVALLRVHCRAESLEAPEKANLFGEASFTVVVHRLDDRRALVATSEFREAESRFAARWRDYRNESEKPHSHKLFKIDLSQLNAILKPRRPLPGAAAVTDRLTFPRDEQAVDEWIAEWPQPVRQAAKELVASRRALLKLNRIEPKR